MTRQLTHLPLILAFVVAGAAPLAAQDPHEAHEQAARADAEAWLALIDAGDYQASWEAAASPFKQAVTPELWAQQGALISGQLGEFQGRRLEDAQYTTELPNVPPGEYVALTYASEFANLPAAREFVTLVLEEGEWRVIGYYVRPAQAQ